MPKCTPRDNPQQSRQKKPYSQQRSSNPNRKGPKPPPSAPVISKQHKEQQQNQQSQSLDLSGQTLNEPPNLAKEYPRLGKLNLTDCGLTDISWISQVKNTLTWLNLSGNKLRDKSAWQGIEQLKTLYGKLTPLFPAVVHMTHRVFSLVTVLNASHCELTEVPQCVSSLQSLKALVLSHNSLTTLEHNRNLLDLNTIGKSMICRVTVQKLIS
jgi:Leucine-rich repeat (LRR) protein